MAGVAEAAAVAGVVEAELEIEIESEAELEKRLSERAMYSSNIAFSSLSLSHSTIRRADRMASRSGVSAEICVLLVRADCV